MGLPTLTFQIAFESNPGDDPLVWTTVPGTKDIEYQRGAPNEYGQMETGVSTVVAGDALSVLDPNNVGVLANYNANPSVEGDTSGWTVRGVKSQVLDAPPGSTGTKSCDATYTNVAANENIWNGFTGEPAADRLAVAAGDEVYVSGQVKWAAGPLLDILWITIRWWKPDGTFSDSAFNTAANGRVLNPDMGTWYPVWGSAVAPAGAAYATVYCTASTGNTLASHSFRVDDLLIAPADAIPDPSAYFYVDGDSPNGRWEGAANASQSYYGGPYYPNVKRGKATRAFLTIAGTDYPLFQHFIERLPRTASEASVWTERSVTGVDAFGGFALAGLKGKSYAGETSGARWGNVLDDVNWPAGRRDIDTGNSTLDPITFDDNADTKALSHLLDVVTSENGFGFMDADGDARFIERHAAITDTTVVATFADGRSIATGDYPDAIPYTDLAPESTDIINDYTGKRDTGAVQTASDATSIDEYGPRSDELTFLVDSDAEVQDAINWRLSQTKDPEERIDAITVMPGSNLNRWAAVLGLEVGDRILVVEWAPGFAAPVETEYLIRHLAGKLPTDLTASEFTFQLTPASTDAWLVLDDATAGQLDANKLAY